METEQPLHTEATLIPGYVNRTLSTDEEQQVAKHLKTCATCQQELQEVTNMQAAIKTSIEQRPGPSSAAFGTLLKRIEQEKHAIQPQTSRPAETSWWETIESAFRSLFEVQWVPALASVLILGQAFLLLSLLGTPEGQRGQKHNVIIERGVPQGTPAMVPVQIQVKFVDTAKEIEIRELLKELGGQIVEGPTSEGHYVLAFSSAEPSASTKVISTLQSHTELVKTAIPFAP